MEANFELTFEDGTSLQGNSLPNSTWNDLPDSEITKFVYHIGDKTITMAGYKQYNHLIEYEALLTGKQNVSKVLLMARREEDTQIIEINFKRRHIGEKMTLHGKEYKGQILTGWKDGILDNPNFRLA